MKNLSTQFKCHCEEPNRLWINRKLILIVSFLFLSSVSNAQSSKIDSLISDTLNIDDLKLHSPNKAALFSTLLPGLGQAYNKKYWKIPIVYAAMGTFLYLGVENNKSFKKFKTAYTIRLDNDPNTVDEYVDRLSDAGLQSNIDYHQRNRDLTFIIASLFYILNVVDAAVDAHLFNFPKNDNLTFNFQPSLELTNNNQVSKGFKLVINL